MADSVSVTTKTSYGERVGNSFKKIIGGVGLVIGSIVLLARNEHRFVERKATLNEGEKNVQVASSENITSELDQQLIHTQGTTSSPAEMLQDSTFGIKTDDLKLSRKVEMYQWIESSSEECHDNVGGSEECTTTYDYKKERRENPVDSDNFYEKDGHNNPNNWAYTSESWEKSPILVGKFTLGEAFTSLLTNWKALSLKESTNASEQTTDHSAPAEPLQDHQALPSSGGEAELSGGVQQLSGEMQQLSGEMQQLSGEVVTGSVSSEKNTPTKPTTQKENFHISDTEIYIGENPQSAKIGDLRITFTTVKTGMVSIVGKQDGNELTSYITSNGGEISLLEEGKKTAAEMFKNAHAANSMLTWILRFVGLFLMYTGFSMMLEFIPTLAKVLPPLASLIGVGTSLIAFAATLVLGLGTIAIAWLAVRPIVGISILVIGVGAAIAFVKLKKKNKAGSQKEK